MSFRTPSYRLHKPTGQAVVTISGRDFYLGKHGTEASRSEYDRLIAEWLTAGRQLPVTDDATISELMVEFLKWADAYYVKDGEPTSEAAFSQRGLIDRGFESQWHKRTILVKLLLGQLKSGILSGKRGGNGKRGEKRSGQLNQGYRRGDQGRPSRGAGLQGCHSAGRKELGHRTSPCWVRDWDYRRPHNPHGSCSTSCTGLELRTNRRNNRATLARKTQE
ncbi:hypothetical protein V5E97_36470 [Singulisphaera sp. Ch08]|uniref:Core-binding (CB) domain-containing protein n=1 Tax=Singulisphaera sp. Ch08 TaxID=3120278 RepID=A0AAU7CSU9_9BACT